MGPRSRTSIGAALGALIALSARAEATPCAPVVEVSGDADAAAEIRTRLAARGVTGAGDAACAVAPVNATVERSRDGLRIEVVDGAGRRSRRDVRDTATAVALIESWIRPEVVEPVDLPGVTAPAPRDDGGVAAAPAAAPALAGFAVLLGPALGGDDATWALAALAGCGSLGPVCIGARLEYAQDTRTTGPGFHPRSVASAAVTAELGWPIGGFVLVGGVGAGVTRSEIGGNGPHMDQTVADTGVRAGGRLAVLRRVGAAWSLELELAGDAAVTGTSPGLVRAALGVRRGWR